jgi:hypothetical protein
MLQTLPPGRYIARIIVRENVTGENVTGKMGTRAHVTRRRRPQGRHLRVRGRCEDVHTWALHVPGQCH